MMAPLDLFKLIFLAAIWGGSFIFLRVAVPEIGPVMTAMLRVSMAAVVLLVYAKLIGVQLHWRRHLQPFALVAVFAAVIPFSCFSFASLYLPAAYSAVLNSTAPLFGALFSVLWLAERMSLQKLTGLALGVGGVAVLVGAGALVLNVQVLLAAAACLFAAACYAVSSIIVKKTGHSDDGQHIHPIAMATGSMVLGALIMLPLLPWVMPATMPSTRALLCVTALSMLSSGVAQALFIPLIVRIGPTRAMSVSFLIPLFSMLWGYLFLGEAVRLATLGGAGIVLLAMGLVLSASHPEPEDALTVET
ncbi:DMT family transporter [Actimicrobium antarcticum]|uniref:EamA family transporter n=1 Tax=Actimicrobium antarcticum TaxID=1051899 RepID=A0ABP7T7D4_9BURK